MIWQTRTLAVFIAGTVPVERQGEESDLMKHAKAIGEETLHQSDNRNNTPNVDENGIQYNSFEKLMSRFGNPTFINRAD